MVKKSLKNNVIFNVFYTIANMLFPLITSMYVSRILGADGVGQVAAAQTYASYYVTVATLGLPIYGIREIAKVRGKEELSKLYSELMVFNFIATSIALSVYVFSVFSIKNFHNNSILYLVCGLQVLFCYFNNDWFYRGYEEYKYILIRSLLVKLLSLICVFAFVRTKKDFIIYALISGIAVGGNYIINFIHARKFVSITLKGLKIRPHIIPTIVLGISVFLESIYGKIDVSMLNVLAGDFATGIYSYAHKTINLILAGCTSITTAFMPRLSFYYKTDIEKFNHILEIGINVLTFLVFPISIGMFILAPSLMQILYGAEFALAGKTARILAMILIINSYSNIICYQVVICTSHEKARLPAAIIACVINVALNYILIPVISENGAAVASVVSELGANMYLYIWIRRSVKIPINKQVFLDAIISSLIMGIAVFVCSNLIVSLYLRCIISVIIGVLCYFLVNLFLHNSTLKLLLNRFL